MQRIMMKSKIHRATITGADLNYIGSITLDTRLMELADIREHEQVHVLDIDNGARFETYVIPGGPGDVILNGAAARLVHPGDKVIVITYAQYDEAELAKHEPRVVHVDEHNQPTMQLAPRGRAVTRRRLTSESYLSVTEPVSDLLVLGSGVAGLSAAVRARREGMSVTVLTKGELDWSATRVRAGWGRRRARPRRRLSRAARLRHAGRRRRASATSTRCACSRARVPTRVRELVALGAHFDQADGRDDFAQHTRGWSLRRPRRARRW